MSGFTINGKKVGDKKWQEFIASLEATGRSPEEISADKNITAEEVYNAVDDSHFGSWTGAEEYVALLYEKAGNYMRPLRSKEHPIGEAQTYLYRQKAADLRLNLCEKLLKKISSEKDEKKSRGLKITIAENFYKAAEDATNELISSILNHSSSYRNAITVNKFERMESLYNKIKKASPDLLSLEVYAFQSKPTIQKVFEKFR